MQEPSPPKQVVEQRIRNRLIEYLEMVVSYQTSPPFFGLNEALMQWEDWVHCQPMEVASCFPAPTYTDAEASHLLAVHGAWEKLCNCTPRIIIRDADVFPLPEWESFVSASAAALRVLQQRGKFSEDDVDSNRL